MEKNVESKDVPFSDIPDIEDDDLSGDVSYTTKSFSSSLGSSKNTSFNTNSLSNTSISAVVKKTQLITGIRAGLTHEVACANSGIRLSTFYAWKKKGSEDYEAKIKTQYSLFYLAIQEAETNFERDNIALIEAAAQNPKLWQAAAWLLERRRPERYGANNDMAISQMPDVTIKFDMPKNGNCAEDFLNKNDEFTK